MASKITSLLSFLLICTSTFSNIPVPFWNEDFSNGQLPPGWEVQDIGSTSSLWQHCTDFNECPPVSFSQAGLLPDRRFKSFSMDNGFAYLTPFGNGTSTEFHSSTLTSKEIDCSTKTEVYLVFNTMILAVNSSPQFDAIVEVKHGEFGVWENFTVFPYLDQDMVETDAEGRIRSYNGQFICLDISGVAATYEDVQIRWRWNWQGDEEYFWIIDDVKLLDKNPINENAVWGAFPLEGNFAGGLNNWTATQSGECSWEWSSNGLIDYPDVNDLADAYSCSCSLSDGLASINPTCSQSFTNAALISPNIDLTNYSGGKRLGIKFSQSGAIGNGASIQIPVTSLMVSIDGGNSFIDTTYINLIEPFSKPFCNTQTIELPDIVATSDNFQFRFVFSGNTFFWSIDDVRIVELYDYDLKISSDYFSVPSNYAVPEKLTDGISLGAEVQNCGNLSQDNVRLLVEVKEDVSHSTVFTDTLYLGFLEAGETISQAYFQNKFTPPSSPAEYTAHYSIEGEFLDLEQRNNRTSFRFRIGGDVLSKQKDASDINGGFAPIGNNIRYEIGNCFFIPPGTSAKTYAMRFATANAAQLAPSNITLKANLYKWKSSSSFADANGDLLVNEDEYEEVTFGYYTLEDETLRLRDVIEVPFNDIITLEDSTYYFTTIEYFAPAIWPNNQEIPFFISASEEINYAAMSDQSDFEGLPKYVSIMKISTDDFFQTNPWGLLRIPFVQLVIDQNTPTKESEKRSETFTLFPNPASTIIEVVLDSPKNGVAIEIYDICGRLVLERQIDDINVSQFPINVSNLSNGIYTLRVYFENAFSVQRFVKTNNSK